MHAEHADNISTLQEWECRCEPRDGFPETNASTDNMMRLTRQGG